MERDHTAERTGLDDEDEDARGCSEDIEFHRPQTSNTYTWRETSSVAFLKRGNEWAVANVLKMVTDVICNLTPEQNMTGSLVRALTPLTMAVNV